jgi:tetratricopeptide (TPR) repeat protein
MRSLLVLLLAVPLLCGASTASFNPQLESAVIAADLRTVELIHQQSDLDADDPDVYGWAYSGWRVSQLLPKTRKRERDKLLKLLQRQLQAWLAEQQGHAEAHALLGSILGDRIGGPLSAMRLGGKASEALERAFLLAPNNPRVALQRGVGFFFTPKAFGGGKAKAEVELRRARALFEANQEAQGWGYMDTLARLGEVLAAQDKFAEAGEVYQGALQQQPDFVWVRDRLLPELTDND